MVQDVRSSTTGGVVFDLLSQTGVMHALQYVRASSASAVEKREVRDLIFSYTNTGGDPALRTLIEQRLASLPSPAVAVPSTDSVAAVPLVPVAPTPVVEVVEQKPVVEVAVKPEVVRYGFGTGRPAPHFSPVVSSAPAKVVETVQAAPVAPPVPVVTSVVPPFVVPEVQVPREVEITPEVPVAAIPLVIPPPPTPAAPEVVISAQPAVPVAPVLSELEQLERQRARIAEIKQDINSRVGNPVNLINTNQELGSAYMSSLLAAMKATAGASGDAVTPMRELEAAYKRVVEFLTPVQTPVVPVVAQDERTMSPSPVVPAASGYATAVAPETEVAPSVAPVISPLSIPRREPSGIPSQTPVKQPIAPVSPMASEHMATAGQGSRLADIVPVAAAAPLKTPRDLPTAADKKAELGITDPLQDPDVDAGLDQLLSEWAIFKKSGMFGTGPRGRQHPMFIKLAPTNMVLMVSGRFDGATPEIRQSITDYMNGWRYEQGITYENDETFEHYLRRVVRHILDLQSNRRRS